MAKAKLIDGIDCSGPSRSGMTLVLLMRFEEMYAFRDAALDWNDPEGVHDMRVASRRLRGALRDFRPFLDQRRLSICLKQIKTIADALGRVRDDDVAMMSLEQVAAKAPADIGIGIQRLIQLRSEAREHNRLELVPALDSKALVQLRTRFTGALATQTKRSRSASESAQQGPPADLTYRKAATAIILNRLAEVESLSAALYHPLKIKALHNLRIAAKHLRYALELFQPCWDRELAVYAKKVSGLQSSLGKLHDCDVWVEELGGSVTADRTRVDINQKKIVAWLLNYFGRMRSKQLAKALAQWHKWEASGLADKLRQKID